MLRSAVAYAGVAVVRCSPIVVKVEGEVADRLPSVQVDTGGMRQWS